MSAGCFKSCLAQTSNFKMELHPNLGLAKEDKALFLAALHFLDYRYFESNPCLCRL